MIYWWHPCLILNYIILFIILKETKLNVDVVPKQVQNIEDFERATYIINVDDTIYSDINIDFQVVNLLSLLSIEYVEIPINNNWYQFYLYDVS